MFNLAAFALSAACALGGTDGSPIRVLAWSERTEPEEIYPKGINGQFAEFLGAEKGFHVTVANMSSPGQGLTEESLAAADVVIWFGHKKHALVTDENVDRVLMHIRKRGMGFIPLHSAHYSKPFQKLMVRIAEEKGVILDSTPGKWARVKANGAAETIHILRPEHPIAKGVSDFVIPHTEIYWNPFTIPPPDLKILEGRYENDMQDGNDGLLWNYGKGKVFYFRPGHETFPIFMQPEVQTILKNAIRFVAK